MKTTSAATASAAKFLLGACAVVAATGLAASPAWANQTAQHRHFPLPVVTSTTTHDGPGCDNHHQHHDHRRLAVAPGAVGGARGQLRAGGLAPGRPGPPGDFPGRG